ncbi:MAG: ABC transporter ATP-binding protein, partial [Candidatus Sumerlaeia bacterium]|nr:ABC transporter ATP-binding protein [Candidatus Sumerlaeia bacterium]
MTAAIRVDRLVKRFGAFTAVNGISFEVPRGAIFGFLGPNGAGKTTTIRMLLGLLTPTAGRIEVLGYEVPRQVQAMRERTGYMSQKFSLYRDLTVGENLEFYGTIYGLRGAELRARKAKALELAGLQEQRHVLTAELAGGWKQRLALACAILHEPELL